MVTYKLILEKRSQILQSTAGKKIMKQTILITKISTKAVHYSTRTIQKASRKSFRRTNKCPVCPDYPFSHQNSYVLRTFTRLVMAKRKVASRSVVAHPKSDAQSTVLRRLTFPLSSCQDFLEVRPTPLPWPKRRDSAIR